MQWRGSEARGEGVARLKRALEALSLTSLGVSLLLAWSSLLSPLGLACPTFEGTLVSKAIFAPLGLAGALAWSLLLVSASYDRSSLSLPLATALIALPASILIDNALPLIAATILLSLHQLRRGAGRLLSTLLAGVCAVETLVAAHLLFWAAGLSTPLSAAWPLHFSLYCLAVPIAPPIVAVSLLSPLLHPLVGRAPENPRRPRLAGRAALAASAASCLLLWLVLYASSLNPGVRLVGVDSRIRYYPHALVLLEEGLPAVARVGYDRPFYYLILYGLARGLGPFEAVKLLPLISLLLYAAACYVLARELWGGSVAGLAALLAPFTYTATAGLFGGLFNNWFSLSLTLLAGAALAKWRSSGGLRWPAAYLLLLALSAASHVYMGAVAFAVFTLMLLAQLVKGSRRSGAAALLILQFALLAVGLNALDALVGGAGSKLLPSRVARALIDDWLGTVARRRPFSPAWWDDFSFAVFNYAATAALDPAVWALTAFTAASLGLQGLGGSLITLWLGVTAALAFLAPRWAIFRAFFDFPYPLAEAFAAALIADRVERRWGARAAALWLAALLLYKFTYTLNFACGLALGG